MTISGLNTVAQILWIITALLTILSAGSVICSIFSASTMLIQLSASYKLMNWRPSWTKYTFFHIFLLFQFVELLGTWTAVRIPSNTFLVCELLTAFHGFLPATSDSIIHLTIFQLVCNGWYVRFSSYLPNRIPSQDSSSSVSCTQWQWNNLACL